MGDTNTIAIVLLVFFLLVSASFTLIKAVFAAIYAKREDHDRTDREAKIAKIVENRGYNETVSIGRIFSDVGIGVFGFYLFSNAPWQWTHDFWLLGIMAYMLCACAVIYIVTIFCPNLIGNLKPDTLSVVLVPLYRLIRMPFVPVGRVCHTITSSFWTLSVTMPSSASCPKNAAMQCRRTFRILHFLKAKDLKKKNAR